MSFENKSYQSIRRTPDELKYEIIQTYFGIIRGARGALVSREKYNAELIAWGGVIESLDAGLSIYWKKDEEYKALRERIKRMVLNINHFDDNFNNKLRIKRLYDVWFSLIGLKLATFKIFPPTPTGYAQGIGEITEEIRLIQEETIKGD